MPLAGPAAPTALLDALLPTSVRQNEDPVVRHRGRIFVAILLACGLMAIASGLAHFLVDRPERALFDLGCIPIGAALLALPHLLDRVHRRRVARGRATRPPGLGATIDVFLGLVLIGMVVGPLLSERGLQVPVVLAVVPLFASALGGVRRGIVWTGMTLLVLAALTAHAANDPLGFTLGWNTLIATVAVGVGGCLAEAARDRARQDAVGLAQAASSLARAHDEKEAELRSSRELLAQAFRQMPALLVLSELPSGRVVDVNECFERLTGWSREEALGRTLSELDVYVSRDDRERLYQRILDRRGTQEVEIALRSRSGQEIWLLVATGLLELNGLPHVLAQGLDITARKQAEQALAASRKLLEERASQDRARLRESEVALGRQRQLASIGTLAAGIAHQINNPIASIMAAAEFASLENEDGTPPDPARQRALRSIIAEAARCGQIVKNVLRFARQQPTMRWSEDLAPLVLRTATLCRGYVTEHGGELRVEIGDVALPAIVSPIEIEQVLVNLIRNAAEALDGSGVVCVRAERRDGRIQIAVDDEGRGMPRERLDQLFQPFFTTRVQQGGTGLGLSFAHGVIVDHGGEIRVESELGKGTQVRILLPLERT
ncbi:MAG: ATP-binding protein [Myxococcota bacterium]